MRWELPRSGKTGKAMKKVVKNQEVKVKRPSKKALIAEISELTGKTPRELDSLARSNIETIAWVKTLVS
tara:strand:- start:480 stop:686 length:207 start_codon:yes stop_codon:yes gene_type:complete